MDLVECIDDPDRNGVFKISNADQKFIVWQKSATKSTKQIFDLSGLMLTDGV